MPVRMLSTWRIKSWAADLRIARNHRPRWLVTRTDPLQQLQPYASYRNSWNPDKRSLEAYNQETFDQINKPMYDACRHEISKSIEKLQLCIERELPEFGSTGKFQYRWLASSSLPQTSSFNEESPPLLYQRRRQNEEWQTIYGVQSHDHVEYMSLSANERLLALAVRSRVTSSLEIRVINCNHCGTVDRADSSNDMLKRGKMVQCIQVPHTMLSAVEFGPSGPGERHFLYWVSANSQDSDADRPSTVYRSAVYLENHDRSTRVTATPWEIVHHCKDESVHVHVQRSKGCNHLLIHEQSLSSNQVWILSSFLSSKAQPGIRPGTDCSASARLVRARQHDSMYYIDVARDGTIYALMSPPGKTSKDMAVFEIQEHQLPLSAEIKHDENNITLFATARPEHVIVNFEIFASQIVLLERSILDGKFALQIVSRTDDSSRRRPRYVTFSDLGCSTITLAGNMNFNSISVRLKHGSPTRLPHSLFVNLHSGEASYAIDDEVHSLPDRENNNRFYAERLLVRSADGTHVPLTLVCDPAAGDNQHATVVLIGYGCYGESVDTSYNPGLQPLLDRGVVLAYAHTRGGGELGPSWHRHPKRSCIEDYLACAEYLKHSWSRSGSPAKLIGKAFSAGGVLVGAAVNKRPDLFDKIVLTNPFLDVYHTMINPDLPLTVHEWEEFGSPAEADTIRSYCPVQTVAEDYPETSFLLTCTLDDTKVPYWNALVYGEKIKAVLGGKQQNSNPPPDVRYWINESGGHDLGANRLHVSALEASFILSDDKS